MLTPVGPPVQSTVEHGNSSPSPSEVSRPMPPTQPANPGGMPAVHAARMNLLPNYLASRINALNDDLRAKGVDVIDLGMGNPVDPVAPNVVERLKEALNDPAHHRYAPAGGIRPLKDAIARHYERHFNVALNPDR